MPLTYKVDGKTLTESFPNPAAQRKAEREIAGFRTYPETSLATRAAMTPRHATAEP